MKYSPDILCRNSRENFKHLLTLLKTFYQKMKKFILFVMTTLLMSCLTLTTSCSDNKPSKEKVVQTIPEKVYADDSELLAMQVTMIESFERQEIFRSIPPNCLKDICRILNHKTIPITIRNVVEEFEEHQDIYIGLQPPSPDIYTDLKPTTVKNLKPDEDGVQINCSHLQR